MLYDKTVFDQKSPPAHVKFKVGSLVRITKESYSFPRGTNKCTQHKYFVSPTLLSACPMSQAAVLEKSAHYVGQLQAER